MRRVEVVEVDGIGVERLGLPEVRDGLGEQAQHSAYALEVRQRRELVGERAHQPGVKRVAACELGRVILVELGLRQARCVVTPDASKRGDGSRSTRVIDACKDAAAQHLGDFVFGGGVEEGSLASRHGLGFIKAAGEPGVLFAVGVGALVLLADREREDQGCARR